MKALARFSLLAPLVLALGLGLTGSARADHQFDHHPFCAQGGGQAGPSSGGPGGTLLDESAAAHFGDSGPGEPPDTVLVPRHLGARFGEVEPPPGFPDPNAGQQFIEIDADDVADDSGGGSGSAFHGGHGGGPGGGQGGSTFFGGGDGGCNPRVLEAIDRPTAPTRRFVPGERLPVTGSLAEQFGILAGLFIALGGMLWMVGGANRVALPGTPNVELGEVVAAPRRERRGQAVVSRLKQQVKGSWASVGSNKG